MKQITFDIHLLADVSIGQRGTIVGARRSKDYLPGHLFLGVAAARLYQTLAAQGDDAWTVFHSGKVRFGDALPLDRNNNTAYPMPRLWHTEGKQSGGEKHITAHNLALKPNQGHRGVKQGFVTDQGLLIRPKTDLRLKTAVDRHTGSARDQRLFGLHAVKAGSRFRFTLEADADVCDDLFRQVQEAVTGERRLGASRSAEYGRVQITKAEVGTPRPSGESPDNLLVLYLLSDMAMVDIMGQPITLPTLADLGLGSEGEPIPEKSFVAHHRYTPYNAHIRRCELERHMISAGSVLTYHRPSGLTVQEAASRLAGRVGLYRQSGMGHIWVNPPMLLEKEATFNLGDEAPLQAPRAVPDHPLAVWLKDRTEVEQKAAAARSLADVWLKDLEACYKTAAQLDAQPLGVRVGPSPTQWGRVRTLARNPFHQAERLRAALFDGEQAVCKEGDPDWGKMMLSNDLADRGQLSFRDWLAARLDGLDEPARALAYLARDGITLARRLEEGHS